MPCGASSASRAWRQPVGPALPRTLGLVERKFLNARRLNHCACLEVLRSCAQAAKPPARPSTSDGEGTSTRHRSWRRPTRTASPSVASKDSAETHAHQASCRVHPALRSRRVLNVSRQAALQEDRSGLLASDRVRLVERTGRGCAWPASTLRSSSPRSKMEFA